MLKDWIEEFIGDVCGGRGTDTPRTYRAKLGRLAAFCGRRALTATRAAEFAKSLQERKKKKRGCKTVDGPLSVYTVRSTLVLCRHFGRWLVEHGHRRANPFAGVRIPRPPPLEPKAITPEMVQAMLTAASGPEPEDRRDTALVLLLRDTGGRVGGLCRALLADVDLPRRRMRTLEKGGKWRTLYLSPVTVRALRRWLHARKDYEPTTDHLLVGRGGRALTRGAAYSALRRLAARAGVGGRFNPHSFRHAFARDMLRAGADLTRVSQLMGHSTVAVTAAYYARWDDAELADAHADFSPCKKMR